MQGATHSHELLHVMGERQMSVLAMQSGFLGSATMETPEQRSAPKVDYSAGSTAYKASHTLLSLTNNIQKINYIFNHLSIITI